jgi:hypothetical protein
MLSISSMQFVLWFFSLLSRAHFTWFWLYYDKPFEWRCQLCTWWPLGSQQLLAIRGPYLMGIAGVMSLGWFLLYSDQQFIWSPTPQEPKISVTFLITWETRYFLESCWTCQ